MHDEASIDVPSYDAVVFKEQVQEEAEKMVKVIEMTQTSNGQSNPVRIAVRIVHPPPDGPRATLESVMYKQKGVRPIDCSLKIWSWVKAGKLDHITIKHEFRISLIMGAIDLKSEGPTGNSMVFDYSEGKPVVVADLNDE